MLKSNNERTRVFRCSILLCFAAILAFTMGMVKVQAVDSGSYQYTDNADGTITITGYTGTETQVTIPDALDGKTVTVIGASAFATKDITAIVIPAAVTSVEKQAFRYCVNLENVTFAGNQLKSIGDEAFAHCKKINKITLPESVTMVGKQAFSNMETLKSYEIPAIETEYGKNVFDGTKVKSVVCKQSSTTYTYMKEITEEFAFSSFYLDELEGKVNVGSTLKLKVLQAVDTITFKSSKPSVASVDEKGVITGLKAGTAEITLSTANETLTFKVTVNKLSISSKKATITAGFTKKLKVKNADKITWSSSNSKVASVSDKGVVNAKKKGKATISAQVGDETYKCKVTVKDNTSVISSYSTNAYNYGSGVLGFSNITKTSKGYTVKGHFINGTSKKIKGIKNMTLTVKAGGKVIAKKYVGNLKLNLGARGTKGLTFTFSGSQVEKKVDLRKYSTISVSVSGAKYYYKETITVPAN